MPIAVGHSSVSESWGNDMDSSIRHVLDRYGPTLAIIAVIVLLVVLTPPRGDASSQSADELADVTAGPGGTQTAATGAGDPAAGDASSSPAAAGASSSARPAVAAGSNAAQAVAGETGSYPCRADGRQAGISFYMPPCAQYDGNNGGATARGVTADVIKVAIYVGQENAAVTAALSSAGAGDPKEIVDRSHEVLRRYFNSHYQTYGREVQLTEVRASGPGGDDVAAKADAQRIAEAGFFAVIPNRGTTGSPTFDEAVARHGVICVGCSVSQSNSFYEATKGYNFGLLPTGRELYENMGEYWGKRLNGKNAEFAGPENPGSPPSPSPNSLRNQKRKFGLIWLSGGGGIVNPGAQEERDFFFDDILPRWGISGVVDASYNFDLTQGPTTAQTVISKMHSEGVTTIAIIGEPFMPVFFTREATKQGYFPEWFISGSSYTDTTFFGRKFDKQQWAHAFGVSPLGVSPTNRQATEGYRAYHHSCSQAQVDCSDEAEGHAINVYRGLHDLLFTGIHMAGPKLTPQTFHRGMLSYPPTGGTSAYPLWAMTERSPNIIKDFAEVWWNSTETGRDELGYNEPGLLMRSNGGARHHIGEWTTGAPQVFSADPSPIYTDDAPYVGPEAPQHVQDGHEHSPDERCLSCAPPE